jgi:diketogulonate reductase-like aldo/keto reductase
MAADQSLKRLRIDHIDLYQLHWPNHAVPIGETMAAMETLVDRGKVRFTRHKLLSNQVRYSLVDRTIEGGLLRYCQEHGIAVIAYSPLARGLRYIEERDRGRTLKRVAALTGKSEAQVALNWCIAKDGVVAIPKASSVDHVEDDCGASGWRLADDHMRLLDCEIRYRRRGYVETVLRRLVRLSLQRLGRNQ